LADTRHGTWGFAVDMPSLIAKRTTMRRGGFATKTAAQAALATVLDCERSGIHPDDQQTVADYLTTWLAEKSRTLKPTTIARYRDYLTKDLIPALGAVRLDALSHQHIAAFISHQLDAGRGLVTLRRCVATLSSALADAVRQRRLPHNAARYATIPRPPKPDRVCWTPAQACTFLQHCHQVGDPLADLFELLIGTGMRKGEALALHWADVHFEERVLFVRHTLSNVNNTTPVLTAPKTKTSLSWIGLSDRVITALRRQADRQHHPDQRFVFTRPNGKPLRPDSVLRRFRQLTAQAGLPRIRVHDLRHLAATLMIASNVPLAVASKTMRHSTLSTTVNIYGHLTPQVAHQAVDAIATALDTADTIAPTG
ncbi:MAG TPA: site-specific integrase, partial [Pseudonocardiaceae bacterium]